MKLRRLFPAASLALLISMLVVALPVQAHATPVRSEPADNSVLATAPTEIKIWFTEPVAGAFSHVQLLDTNGHLLPLKSVEVDKSDPTLMVMEPPALGDGVYTVSWLAASASDGHVSRGSFVFRVGKGPAGVVGAETGGGSDPANPPVSIPEAVLRWLGYFGLLAMAGAAGVPRLVLRLPKGEAENSSLGAFFGRASGRISFLGAAAAAFAFVVSLLYLAWQASSLAGDNPGASGGVGSALVGILFSTTWGYAWLARQALITTLGLVFLRLGRVELGGSGGVAVAPPTPGPTPPEQTRDASTSPKPVRGPAGAGRLRGPAGALAQIARTSAGRFRGWQWLAIGLAGATLASEAVTSHAAGGRSPSLPILVDWLHLVFAGLWVGGLFALAVGILPILRREGQDFKVVGRAAWGRFGPLAAVSVGMLAATGLYSAGQRVISADALILTGYGRVLMVKVGLMLVVGLLGLVNSLSLHPGLVAPLARWLKKPPGWTPFGLRNLPRRILAEASLGVGVVLLAGILTTLPPASEPQFAVSPSSQPAQMIATINDLYIGLSIKPNRPGQNILDILAASTQRPAPAEVLRVIVRMTYLEQDLGTISVDATSSNPNSYHLTGDALSQPGRWKIDVVVRRKGLPDSVASFNWTVMPLGNLQPPVLSRSPWKEALSILAGLVAALVALGLGITYLKPKRWWGAAPGPTSRAARLGKAK